MIDHAVPAGRIYDAEDMLTDPHFAAREAIVMVEDPELGPVPMQGVFPKLSRTPSSIRRLAPRTVGQDTQEILERWLGASAPRHRSSIRMAVSPLRSSPRRTTTTAWRPGRRTPYASPRAPASPRPPTQCCRSAA